MFLLRRISCWLIFFFYKNLKYLKNILKFKKKVLMSQTYFWKEVRPTFSVFSCAKYRVTVARDLKINWGKKMEPISQFEAKCITRCPIPQGPDLSEHVCIDTHKRTMKQLPIKTRCILRAEHWEREGLVFLSNFDIWVFVCFVALCLLHFCRGIYSII